MKKMIITVLSVVSFFLGFDLIAYPTEEEARYLFSSNQINKSSVSLDTADYMSFVKKMNSCNKDKTKCRKIESIILSGIMSVKVVVSTNVIDNSIGMNIIDDRSDYIKIIGSRFCDFKINKNACIDLSRYVGTLRVVPYPTDLIWQRSSYVQGQIFISTNATEMAQWRKRQKVIEAERALMARQRKKSRDLQMRVYHANKRVVEYRKTLLLLCGEAIAGCRKIMSDEEFSSFTNDVIRLSNANEEEKRFLFKKLNEEQK